MTFGEKWRAFFSSSYNGGWVGGLGQNEGEINAGPFVLAFSPAETNNRGTADAVIVGTIFEEAGTYVGSLFWSEHKLLF